MTQENQKPPAESRAGQSLAASALLAGIQWTKCPPDAEGWYLAKAWSSFCYAIELTKIVRPGKLLWIQYPWNQRARLNSMLWYWSDWSPKLEEAKVPLWAWGGAWHQEMGSPPDTAKLFCTFAEAINRVTVALSANDPSSATRLGEGQK